METKNPAGEPGGWGRALVGRGAFRLSRSQLFIFTLSLPRQSCSPPLSLSSPFIPLPHFTSFPSYWPLFLALIVFSHPPPLLSLPTFRTLSSLSLLLPFLSPPPPPPPLSFLGPPPLSLFLTFLSPSPFSPPPLSFLGPPHLSLSLPFLSPSLFFTPPLSLSLSSSPFSLPPLSLSLPPLSLPLPFLYSSPFSLPYLSVSLPFLSPSPFFPRTSSPFSLPPLSLPSPFFTPPLSLSLPHLSLSLPFRISLVCLSYFPHSPPRLFLFFTIFLCSPSLSLPSLDMILDMLRSEDARTAILSYYQDSDEPRAVREAIKESCKTSAEESGLQKWVSLHHVPLHGSLYCWRRD